MRDTTPPVQANLPAIVKVVRIRHAAVAPWWLIGLGAVGAMALATALSTTTVGGGLGWSMNRTVHDASHSVVTSVPVGSTVHVRVAMSGSAGPFTGSVVIRRWATSACSGTPAAESGALAVPVGGVIEATAFSYSTTTPSTAGFTVSYSGDSTYSAGVGSCFSVAFMATPTMRLRVHDDFHTEVTTVGAGSNVHGYVTLAGTAGTPTGSVVIASYTTPDCTSTASSQTLPVVNGVVEATTKYVLNAGTRTFRAIYGGSTTYTSVTSPCVSVAVGKLVPLIGLTLHDFGYLFPDNWPVGMDLFLNVGLGGDSALPTGTVSIRRHAGHNCQQLGLTTFQATVSSGLAYHGPWDHVDPGPYSVQVRYNGNTTYAARVACKNYTMQKATLTVPLAAHTTAHQVVASVKAGTPFHMSTVLPAPVGTPTGTVTFARWANPDCSGALVTDTVTVTASGGAESPAVTLNTADSWGLKATYSGNARYAASASACVPFTIAKATAGSAVELHDALHVIKQPVIGQSTHPRATFTGPAGTPTGTATWQIWPTPDCSGAPGATFSGAIVSGVYHPTTGYFPPTAGAYSMRLGYSGNATYEAFAGSCVPVTVSRVAPTGVSPVLHDAAHQVVTTIPVAVQLHSLTTVTGTLGAPTGNAVFKVYANGTCTGTPGEVTTPVTLGTAHQTAPMLFTIAGTKSYRVSYGGDAKYLPKDSACLPFTVTKGDPSMSTAIHNGAHSVVGTVFVGIGVHPFASMEGLGVSVPLGTATARIFENGTCTGTAVYTYAPKTLSSGDADFSPSYAFTTGGSKSIQVTYNGDANWLAKTGACMPLTVNKVPPVLLAVIHNQAHATVSTVSAGTTVHGNAAVVPVGVQFAVTGSVTFKWYADGACGGAPTLTQSVTLSGGSAEGAGVPMPTGGSRSLLVSYSGSATYASATGLCTALTVTKVDATMLLDVHNADHDVVTAVPIGTSVHPAVALSGHIGVPTGSVQFRWYTNGTCAGDGVANNVALNGASLDASSVIASLGAPGSGSFRATWGGDATHNPAASQCAPVVFNEKLEAEVELLVHNAGHATVATVAEGTSIHPRAAVSGSGPTPTGTVVFRWYDSTDCARVWTAGSTPIALSGGVVDGTAFAQTPPNAGTVAFIAGYSGDGQYNSALSACEIVTVVFEGPSVESFEPTVTPTGASAVDWTLVFDEPVSGLTAADLALGGSSTGWTIGAIEGSGATWSIGATATNPTMGSLQLTLAADSVVNGDDTTGPNEPSAAGAVTILPFADITNSTFRDDIVWLYESGITTGCGIRLYCPTAPVTRAQMASFLARALDLPATAIDFFDDDEGSTHEANINRLAAAGITLGCGPSLYCPNANVTRAQMASFLVRALGLTAGGDIDAFTDDEGSTHETDINRLKFAGLTTGCTATTFCPTANVTRGQMAAFLHRALVD